MYDNYPLGLINLFNYHLSFDWGEHTYATSNTSTVFIYYIDNMPMTVQLGIKKTERKKEKNVSLK